MSQIRSISIPQPCHESWQQMAPVDGGRHCQNCAKTVTDFTAMTNSEIVHYLALHKNVCGRINNYQLTEINSTLLADDRPIVGKWGFAALLVGILSVTRAPANAQRGNPKNISILPSTPSIIYNLPNTRHISGNVKDQDGYPVAGADIRVQGTDIRISTQMDGNFSMDVPEFTDTLIVSSIGYLGQHIKIDSHLNSVNVILTEDKVFAENNICVTTVGGLIAIKRSFLWRAWYYFKKPFRTIF